ncbi:MAG: hypothetical protein KatS3mg013_0482 [Actinomycetota bacterium]|nr:MAG: hypothetical protein KatS3mg013_0482 [Actinomycetota bacterium]
MTTRVRTFTIAIAVGGALALTACGGGGDAAGANGNGGNGTEDGTATGAATVVTITAPQGSANTGFAETSVSAPADTPFTIHFVNDDPGIPHNVQIFEGEDTSGEPIWAPEGDELITGPAEAHYEIPPLPAGTYTYNCLAHPTTMVGTLTVG